MKKLIFGIFGILLSINVLAQKNSYAIFGKPWIANNNFLLEYAQNNGFDTLNENIFHVPLVIRIYKGEKDSRPNFQEIKKNISNLNRVFADNNCKIDFYVSDVIFKQNNKYSFFKYFRGFVLKSTFNNTPKLIDVLLVNRFVKEKGEQVSYYTGSCNLSNKSVIISYNCPASGFAHEIGHSFGLKHVFKNCDKGSRKQESADTSQWRKGLLKRGFNNEINGDGLRDTYASKNLVNLTDSIGNITEDLYDKWGNKYTPQVNNIMGYTFNKNIRTEFTELQKKLMFYNINSSKIAKYYKNPKCKADQYEYDDDLQAPTILDSKQEQKHNFHLVLVKGKKFENKDIDCFKFSKKEDSIIKISGQIEILIEVFNNNKEKIANFTKNKNEDLIIDIKDYDKNYYLKLMPKNKEYNENFYTIIKQ